jgi:hypothetical protein
MGRRNLEALLVSGAHGRLRAVRRAEVKFDRCPILTNYGSSVTTCPT